jgi:hypothetical protein
LDKILDICALRLEPEFPPVLYLLFEMAIPLVLDEILANEEMETRKRLQNKFNEIIRGLKQSNSGSSELNSLLEHLKI